MCNKDKCQGLCTSPCDRVLRKHITEFTSLTISSTPPQCMTEITDGVNLNIKIADSLDVKSQSHTPIRLCA